MQHRNVPKIMPFPFADSWHQAHFESHFCNGFITCVITHIIWLTFLDLTAVIHNFQEDSDKTTPFLLSAAKEHRNISLFLLVKCTIQNNLDTIRCHKFWCYNVHLTSLLSFSRHHDSVWGCVPGKSRWMGYTG